LLTNQACVNDKYDFLKNWLGLFCKVLMLACKICFAMLQSWLTNGCLCFWSLCMAFLVCYGSGCFVFSLVVVERESLVQHQPVDCGKRCVLLSDLGFG
jgi:hypothetical protein